jgi:predicted O-linked N-acetylglucosamine transferase (SPINDLY family)
MSATGTTILDQMRARASQLYHGGRFEEAASAYRGILEVVPQDFDAVRHMGLVAIHLGHPEEARRLLQGALNFKPDHDETWLHYGMALQHLGRTDDAVAAYERAISLKPDYSEALFCLAVTQKSAGRQAQALENFNRFIALRGDQPAAFLTRGDILRDKGNVESALADYESALTLRPDFYDGWMHRGTLLAEHGRPEEALACYEKAGALMPQRGEVWYNRGVALQDLGRMAEALDAYEQAVQLSPEFADAWNNRGVLLRKTGRRDEALASFDRALFLDPKHIQSLNNKGALLTDLRRFEEALAVYDRALGAAPDQAVGWYNRGIALHDLGRDVEALASYEQAVTLDPGSADSWNNRGNLLRHAGRLEEAMSSFQRALDIDPRHAETLANAGAGMQSQKRFAEAGREFRKLEMVAPDHKYLLSGIAVSAMALCDWTALERIDMRLRAEVMRGRAIVPPFTLLGLSDDAALHQAGAVHYLADFVGTVPASPRPAPHRHDRIRLAYVSSDFHAHATARLMADLFERHDRNKFEVIAISFSPDEQSDIRARLVKSFDQFHDVRKMSDEDAANLMRRLEIDIAVDLKGYTEDARLGIFARRPAPVQVSYLGYPGTTGAEFMDYVLADPVVLPMDRQQFYSEKIVQLPDCYQSNDPGRAIGRVPTRQEAGLPADAFIFSCFNNHWKITRPVFESWMRILEAVPGSVLWLLDDSANANLVREAKAHGIAPERLIFAPKISHDEHLGRLSLADLVLDTLPYNAHTTASDALWSGVPLVTCEGQAFAGRVAASLLAAAGLPELIAQDLAGYEKLVLDLAGDPGKHKALKQKLAKNRSAKPLFDGARFCRHIEAAFTTMAEKAGRGEAPEAFAVPAQG